MYTEQIVSRAMPLLYSKQMAAPPAAVTADLTGQVRKSTLLNRQGADGAIGLWRVGDREATPWLGAYATDSSSAPRRQAIVPDAALDKAAALEEFAVRSPPIPPATTEVYKAVASDTKES
jgi:uncharacterized protein YfaS (alpha-2-macroglobulin family)